MVEVFKTNVNSPRESKRIVGILKKRFPSFKINIDLQDCDRVLRVEGRVVAAEEIIAEMRLQKHICEPL